MDPAVPEGEVRSRRLKTAILVGLAVTAAQFLPFALIAYRAYVSVGSESSPLRVPLVLFSFLHRGQIVYPVLGGIKFGYRNFSFTEVQSLRHVDLADGQVRDTMFPIVVNPTGIVSNQDRLWCFGRANEVYETDGTDISNWKTQRTLKLGAIFPFLYEDRPAVIERSPNGRFLLFVLTDREWESRGEIAIPGADRSWITDEQSGRKVLIPRTCASDMELKSKEIVPQIVSANGRIHQFIPDSGSGACYRAGFDFVDRDENAECVSAFAPENDQADTAGWVLLDSKLNYGSKFFLVPTIWRLSITSCIWRQTQKSGERISEMDLRS